MIVFISQLKLEASAQLLNVTHLTLASSAVMRWTVKRPLTS